ncbi:MAG TPA: hypothetical protein VFX09_05255 [Burkholderiales bacterium]|nr:hypothetical protein [Burkholderiales bacterium]
MHNPPEGVFKLSDFDLKGRAALVTGGIGLGMAPGLARFGAAVAVAGRDPGQGASAQRELQVFGNPAFSIQG